ncbi:LuxR C-terminal-related transcriptional regulator [Micromonospora sp. NPDC048999]|uniref:helix-turn-helix transcriptional regulator n=1 Tax=Micromonospora sp. NPDC048999 TaxID=3155391 RepID=UPI0033C1C6D5
MSTQLAPVAADTTSAATPRLTIEQRYLLWLLAEGETHASIGRRIGVTTPTARMRLSRTYRQIGARNACHAVAIACRAGLLPAPEQPGDGHR